MSEHFYILFRHFFSVFFVLGLSIHSCFANVIMTGTRVIFNAESKEKTLQFSNKSDIPYLVQVWLDQGNDNSTPESADAPFLVSPQAFRVNAHQGQMARLVYVPEDVLPQDRESIFYINFKQTPALSKDLINENKLVLIVKNRLKVFYRPKNLPDKIEDVARNLRFQLLNDAKGSWLQIDNPSSYYANLTQASVKIGTHIIQAQSVQMIEPKSKGKWLLEKRLPAHQLASVSIRMVNDYGATDPYDISPQISR